jgi:hypothetical protein
MTDHHDKTADRDYCGCQRAFRLDKEHHDWLLTFEERGLAGAMQLVSHFAESRDCEVRDDYLHWVDFPQFVAMHSWQSPADVYDLASFIEGYLRQPDGPTVYEVTLAAEKVLRLLTPVERLRALRWAQMDDADRDRLEGLAPRNSRAIVITREGVEPAP